MPCPALMGGHCVVSLHPVMPCMAVIIRRPAPFLKGNRGAVTMGLRGEGNWGSRGTGGCGLGISYERRIRF